MARHSRESEHALEAFMPLIPTTRIARTSMALEMAHKMEHAFRGNNRGNRSRASKELTANER